MSNQYNNRGDAEKQVDYSREVNPADVISRDDISVDGLLVGKKPEKIRKKRLYSFRLNQQEIEKCQIGAFIILKGK